jgi:tripartite-type tricarboxylate transporter receptor subunit TctC
MIRWIAFAAVLSFSIMTPSGSNTAAQTAASDYPNRTVTMVVPFPAGGGTDAIARLMTQKLANRWGKNFVVENRVGAGGNVAGNAVARSAPDGYTLMMATSGTLSTNISLYKSLPYDPTKDLVPIALICAVPFVLVVHPDLPVKSVSDLVKLAKSRTPKLNYASGGAGTFHHMMGEMLKVMTGIDMAHVPYKGGAPGVNDVVAGHVPLMFAELPAVKHLVEAGKLRALGITTKERALAAPNIPPLTDAGLPGFDASAWQMVAAPAGVPAAIRSKLNTELNSLVADAEVRKSILDLGFNPIGQGGLNELSQYVRAETIRWKELIDRAGIALD